MSASRDTAGVIAPPPLIFLGFLLAGWGIGQGLDLPGLGLADSWRRGIALAGLVTGIVIEGWAAGLFRRAGTALQPWKPTTALVVSGLYRFSRNPVYLGFAVTYLGVATGLDSPVALALLLPCLGIIDRFVIAREEVYLEARFGTAYRDYRSRVRRWL